ncbi:hypothetical protein ISU10_21090 [Nocardioides agariphilus]|uniref:Uncharacterized protein n=1 Tax=Nocardioides agariphilus TaxID=433664 RepID=A0A930YPI3_9ACTN|nr:hypothetical protein [Nocardioides agariphilus]MBF4770279.1 hypothetical protein [Nocardioides agariphilus]
MSALEVSTLVIAVVGAVTGVAALATQVWGLLIAGPRIKVTVANALVPIGGPGGSLTWALSLDASNVGRLPVTILDAGTTFRAGREWKKAPLGMMPADSWHGDRAPYRLADGEATTWILEPVTLAQAAEENRVRDVYGYVRLATGKTVRSRKPIDIINLATLD